MIDPAAVARLGTLIDELTRALARGGPAPRALACFGLESTSGSAPALLDALSAHGIFRKYETVLALGDALGGTARWLVGRLGCSAVATAPGAAAATAAATLTRRAGLRSAVRHVPAATAALPFRDAVFTHVWAVEPGHALSPPALAEALRVLRPGGHFALQQLADGDDCERWAAAVRAAGFAAVQTRDVTGESIDRAARTAAARERLRERLRASEDPGLVAEAERRDAIGAAIAAGTLRVLHVVARRA